MSNWDDWRWYTPAPKRPPPRHGIRMKKSGATWWGHRWVEALERMSAGYSNRLARGKTYARAGRTHDLVVKDGRVTARVTGSAPTPYRVTMVLKPLRDAVWAKAIKAMARKAQFSAELLAGRMPHEIDAAFKEAGGSVFPVKDADLATECSCPDWANPCKHIAAAHYVLGEAIDRDPFLLFELRGRSRAQVLEAMRASRTESVGGARSREGGRRAPQPVESVPAVSLAKVKAPDYDRPRAPLPALKLSLEAPGAPGSLLRQLGAPAGWTSDASPEERFGPVIRRAAEMARGLAMAEAGAAPPQGRAGKTRSASGSRRSRS